MRGVINIIMINIINIINIVIINIINIIIFMIMAMIIMVKYKLQGTFYLSKIVKRYKSKAL